MALAGAFAGALVLEGALAFALALVLAFTGALALAFAFALVLAGALLFVVAFFAALDFFFADVFVARGMFRVPYCNGIWKYSLSLRRAG